MLKVTNKPKIDIFFVFIFLIAILPLQVHADTNNSSAPVILYKNITPDTVAYKGSETPGYLTIDIRTNKPTRGYIDVIGNTTSTKIEISNVEFNTDHKVYWTPWNLKLNQELPPGEYTLKLNLTDEANNSISGYTLGKITVVKNQKTTPLIEILDVTPKKLIADPEKQSIVTFKYKVNRPAKVIAEMQSTSGKGYNGKGLGEKQPGIYEVSWDLRDTEGNLVSPGYYEVFIRGMDLTINESQRGFRDGSFGPFEVIKKRLTEDEIDSIISNVKFNVESFTPNGDGINDTVSGSITVNKKASIDIWVTNGVDRHVKNIIKNTELNPGETHTFTWDGKDFMNSISPNATYYLKAYITDERGIRGELLRIEGVSVRVEGSYDFTVPQPVKRVRVIKDTANMNVTPYAQPITVHKGDVFPVLDLGLNTSYSVLAAEGIRGEINIADVELLDIDTIPEKWGQVSKERSELYKDYRYRNIIEANLHKGTPVHILHEFGSWYHIALNSGKQGFIYEENVDLTDIQKPFTVHTVASDDALWKISQKYGTTVETIVKYNNLNAEDYLIIGQQIIIPGKPVESPDDNPSNIVYTIQSDDTLWKIAQKYNVTIDSIVKTNNLNPNNYLVVGEKILIPTKDSNNVVYIVKSGDSLWKIANAHNTTMYDIANASKISIDLPLMVGQKLVIPNQTNNSDPDYKIYTVQSGDTLWKIAQRFGTTIQNITTLNEINVNEHILAGQQLKINI